MDKQPPYREYAAIMGVFGAGLAAAGGLAGVLGRNPAGQTPLDFVVLSAASFKAARTLARDEVTSFLREPFVDANPRAAVRAPADLVARRCRRERFPAGDLQGPDGKG